MFLQQSTQAEAAEPRFGSAGSPSPHPRRASAPGRRRAHGLHCLRPRELVSGELAGLGRTPRAGQLPPAPADGAGSRTSRSRSVLSPRPPPPALPTPPHPRRSAALNLGQTPRPQQPPRVCTHLRPSLRSGGGGPPAVRPAGPPALLAAGEGRGMRGRRGGGRAAGRRGARRGAPGLFKSRGPYPRASPALPAPLSLSQRLAACLAAAAPPRLAGDPRPAAAARGAGRASRTRLPVPPGPTRSLREGGRRETVLQPPREVSRLPSPEGGSVPPPAAVCLQQ